MANDSAEKDPQDHPMPQQASLQAAYEALRDAREAVVRDKHSHPSTDLGNIPEDRLLILCATEAIRALVLRGHVEFHDNPDHPSLPIMAFTEQGRIAAGKALLISAVDKPLRVNPWVGFPFRPGDIVISTAPKNGTTWMQMICALLIFQTTALPASIPELSPWPDSPWPGERDRIKEFATQQHRRFIKTHMQLSEIPADPNVTYIVVARDPLDAVVSQHHQDSVIFSANDPGQPNGKARPHKSAREFTLGMIDQMGTPPRNGRYSFIDRVLKHLCCAWERRTEPNVVLVHYEDLSADLPGEMRQLARRLDIEVPADIWPTLVQSATLKEMRAAADQLQPMQFAERRDASKGHAAFFRRGSSGDGRALLTEAEAALYYTRASQIAPQELLAWLHRDDGRYPTGTALPQ